MKQSNILLIPFRDRQNLEQFEQLLKNNNLPIDGLSRAYGDLLLLMDEELIIGGVAMEIYGSFALLRSLVVDERYRGLGYGKLLLERIQERARVKGITHLYLLTETIAPLLEKLGFEKFPRDKVPQGISTNEEFSSLCPASATTMHKALVF